VADLVRARLEDYVYRVRAARKSAGLSTRAVADALGIPRSAYRSFERTELLPLNHVATFCATVHCSPLYLLTGEVHTPQLHVLADERAQTH
jgi:transcriptional regulator with XRE-family HTH domain